jgi:hypothetical protein
MNIISHRVFSIFINNMSSHFTKEHVCALFNSVNLNVDDVIFKSSIVGKSAIVHLSVMPKNEAVEAFNKGFSYSGSFNNRELWWIKTANINHFNELRYKEDKEEEKEKEKE